MIIPNDTGHPYRVKKFIEYQHNVPSIHYRTLGQYILEHNLSSDDAIMLSWYMSVTYSEITCMFMFETLDWRTMKFRNLKNFWGVYKKDLNFGSARKYAKNMDWFLPLMNSFMKMVKRKPYKWLKGFRMYNPTETYTHIYKTISSIEFVGRFSADLFMEMIVHLSKLDVIDIVVKVPLSLDWKNCSNLTSGLFNIFYKDEEANNYDKTKVVTAEDIMYLNRKILDVQKYIHRKYPEQDSDLMMFVGKICSFRNLFKGARYGGFHHDRQLGVLKEYEKAIPMYQTLWDDVYGLRKKMFPENLLGEYGGWSGIQKERKKLWIQEGETGCESISKH